MGCAASNGVAVMPKTAKVPAVRFDEDGDKLLNRLFQREKERKKEPKPQRSAEEKKKKGDKTQLHNCLKSRDMETFKNILSTTDLSPEVEISKAGFFWNSFHYAANFNNYAALDYSIKWLYQNKQEKLTEALNAKTFKGSTPAMLAVMSNNIEALQVLLVAGGTDLSLSDNENRTVRNLAKVYKAFECTTLLNSYPKDEILPLNEEYLKSEAIVSIRTKSELNDGRNEKMTPQNIIPMEEKDFQKLKIYKILEEAKAKAARYEDPDFPPDVKSISSNTNLVSYSTFKKATWLRPNSIFPNQEEIKVFNFIDPNDIKQGALGICYFLSVLSSLAEFPERVQKIFNCRHFNEQGAYSVTFYKSGLPEEVIIDDQFPCMPDNNTPLFVKPNGNELWVMILEKAWAKFIGRYMNCEAMCINDAMEHVTGAPAKGLWVKDFQPQALFDLLESYDKNMYIISATSKEEAKKEEGIVPMHAYSIISTHRLGKDCLLKLRNTWGNFEFEGKYNDRSSLWTEENKQLVNFISREDGLFFMTLEEFAKYFQHISVCFYRSDFTLKCQAASTKHKASYFTKFTLTHEQEVSLRLHQTYARFFKETNPKYAYSPSWIFLYNTSAGILASGDDGAPYGSFSARPTNDEFLKLPAGEYVLRAGVNWQKKNEAQTFGLSLYSLEGSLESIDRTEAKKVFIEGIVKEGEKNKTKTSFGNNCSFANGWIGPSFMYLWFENKSERLWKVTVTMDLKNMAIGKRNRINEKTVELSLKPGSVDVAYVKRASIKEQPSVTWRFATIWINN